MKQKYKDWNPKPDTLELIGKINQLVRSYQAQGYTLSVRQLYYQLVSRIWVPENTFKMYKKVASIINDGRLAGLIDWDAIEDRGRDIVKRAQWDSPSSIIRVCANTFHMDMWTNQDYRVYAIVEKAALAGVMDRVCRKYDVPLLAAKGYPSVSIVRDLVKDYFWSPAINEDQGIAVLHFGDHDPSGIDMTRDLQERIDLFTEGRFSVAVKRMALNMDQVEEQNPPPNFAKETDSRFEGYKDQYGEECWELDALEPAYISSLLQDEIETHIDQDAWKKRENEITDAKERLAATADEYEADE